MKRQILFLGCNEKQMPYLQYLRSNDYQIIGIDKNKDAPGKDLCHKFYNYGYDDIDSLLAVGEKESFKSTDKVFTASAQFANKGNAIFAKHFEIDHPSEKSIDFCLDKVTYYKYFLRNNIPIPVTSYLKTRDELDHAMDDIDPQKWFYLKSDFSKNPNYVYRICKDNFNSLNIFWGRDRYLREFYILQEEYPGTSLRINIYGERFNIIDFNNSLYTYDYHDLLKKFNTIEILKILISDLGLSKWLIKFDVIVNEDGYVVLDIGLDPPSRMIEKAKLENIKFEEFYLKQYLEGKIIYPKSLD